MGSLIFVDSDGPQSKTHGPAVEKKHSKTLASHAATSSLTSKHRDEIGNSPRRFVSSSPCRRSIVGFPRQLPPTFSGRPAPQTLSAPSAPRPCFRSQTLPGRKVSTRNSGVDDSFCFGSFESFGSSLVLGIGFTPGWLKKTALRLSGQPARFQQEH